VVEETNAVRDRKLEQIRTDIEAETQRAMAQIRSEVASLTVQATEKVTRRTLTEDDQRRLIDDALSELDFSALSGGKR
jgi:F-type H+-transporting ATPase subunit b